MSIKELIILHLEHIDEVQDEVFLRQMLMLVRRHKK